MTSREQITSAFVAFRDELDDANDRRDRIIKASAPTAAPWRPRMI
jgi:hypothetical protein